VLTSFLENAGLLDLLLEAPQRLIQGLVLPYLNLSQTVHPFLQKTAHTPRGTYQTSIRHTSIPVKHPGAVVRFGVLVNRPLGIVVNSLGIKIPPRSYFSTK